MRQEEKEQELNHTIVDLKKEVSTKEEQKKRAWSECMKALSLLKPKFGVRSYRKIVMPRVPEDSINEQITKESLEDLAREVYAKITREDRG